MSKILASRDRENEQNKAALGRLAILGGAVVVVVLVAILLFAYLS